MSAFKNDPDEWQRLDWQILQNGWTSLYWQEITLENDLSWFKSEKFNIVEINCTNWLNVSMIHTDLKKYLDFPDYYGENFNARNDCLSDIKINDFGFVIVFRHFQFVENDIAHILLDILANNSRLHILFGKKLLTLVQVDNPEYEIKPVGACGVLWNVKEWPNSKRET
jgi:RNAse (barnase) inhibitor barstar